MYRSRVTLFVAALSLLFLSTGCKSGPSDPASYRAAMGGMAPAMTKLETTTRDASTAGDPMQLSSALTKTVSSAKSLVSVIKKVEVSEPSLSGLHANLLGAAQNHLSALEEAAASAKATPIPETKTLMEDSTAALNEAIQEWNDALDGM